MQKTKEDDFLKLFERWKEEEKEKLLDEMEKVKEMFMKEFKELTSKNSALEYVSLYTRSSHTVACFEVVLAWHCGPRNRYLTMPGTHSSPTGVVGHTGGRAGERNWFVMSGQSVQALVQNTRGCICFALSLFG